MPLKPLALALAVVLLAAASCSQEAPVGDDVVSRVNGVDIMNSDLDFEFARAIAGADPVPGPEQTLDLKLQLLSDMIVNEILLQRAAEAELTATDAEVDGQFNAFRNQYTEERFAELLAQQQATLEDVRRDMRRGLTIDKLINKEITSKISITQAEIEEFYAENVASFNLPESFRLAHILVTPSADATITNSTGDDAQTSEEAATKAQRLLRDIQGGQDFATVARQYSEDPTTAAAGGDLGFQPMEALTGVDPAFGDAVTRMREGETFPRVVATSFGYHVLRLIERDPGGQKDLTDPQIEAQVRQIIFNRRDQLLRAAFFETVRNEAEVRNYFARRVLENAGAGS
jgi:peptidyl-prolyl cis-trans isomerase SurA